MDRDPSPHRCLLSCRQARPVTVLLGVTPFSGVRHVFHLSVCGGPGGAGVEVLDTLGCWPVAKGAVTTPCRASAGRPAPFSGLWGGVAGGSGTLVSRGQPSLGGRGGQGTVARAAQTRVRGHPTLSASCVDRSLWRQNPCGQRCLPRLHVGSRLSLLLCHTLGTHWFRPSSPLSSQSEHCWPPGAHLPPPRQSHPLAWLKCHPCVRGSHAGSRGSALAARNPSLSHAPRPGRWPWVPGSIMLSPPRRHPQVLAVRPGPTSCCVHVPV